MNRAFFHLLLLAAACSILQAKLSVVVLDSGEHLKGELLSNSNYESVTFRSVALGEVIFSRNRIISIREEGQESKKDTEALVFSEAREIFSDKPTNMSEKIKFLDNFKFFDLPNHWSGDLRLGLNFSQGNRQWTQAYARGKLEIKPEKSPHYYRYIGSYTYRYNKRSSGTEYKSVDKYDLQFIYRHTLSDNWFVQNTLNSRVDQIKGIDRELQESVGIGYSLKPSSKLELIVGAGGGIEYFDVEYKDPRSGTSPLINVFQEVLWNPFNKTSFAQEFSYYFNPEDNNQYGYLLTAGVRIRLTDLLGLEFSFNKTYDNDISDNDAKNDTQWRNSVVFYF